MNFCETCRWWGSPAEQIMAMRPCSKLSRDKDSMLYVDGQEWDDIMTRARFGCTEHEARGDGR